MGCATSTSTRLTGKYQINGATSATAGWQGTIALGASAVVIYRDPDRRRSRPSSSTTAPTRWTRRRRECPEDRGFYDGGYSAKLTHIVGSGQANKSENLRVNGTEVATNPFAAVQGLNWDNPTFDLTPSKFPNFPP